MALRWVLHTACHALGYQNDNKIESNNNKGAVVGYQKEQHQVHGNGDIQIQQQDSLKVVSNNNKNGSSSSSQNLEAYYASEFQLPLHYPRYSKADYEKMEDWKLDLLLREYGLTFQGTLDEKRAYAMGAFLWPHQY